jgi:hypothetical protein
VVTDNAPSGCASGAMTGKMASNTTDNGPFDAAFGLRGTGNACGNSGNGGAPQNQLLHFCKLQFRCERLMTCQQCFGS